MVFSPPDEVKKPVEKPVPPPDVIPASRQFKLIKVTRGINGILTAHIFEQSTKKLHAVELYDRIGPFIVTGVDFTGQTASVVNAEAEMEPQTLFTASGT